MVPLCFSLRLPGMVLSREPVSHPRRPGMPSLGEHPFPPGKHFKLTIVLELFRVRSEIRGQAPRLHCLMLSKKHFFRQENILN